VDATLDIEGLTIERWAHGGDGVGIPSSGPLSGAVVFVPDSVPGDVLDVRVVVRKRKWARARLTRIRVASPHRVTPPCRHQLACGGCPWMNGSEQAQRHSREHVLRAEARKRLGWSHTRSESRVHLCSSQGPSLGYRVRARLVYQVDAEGQVVMGYRGRRSHAPIDVEQCAVLAAPLQAAWPALRKGLGDQKVTGGGELDLLLGREGWGARVRPEGGAPWEIGRSVVSVRQGQVSPRCRPGDFVQANPVVLEALVSEVQRLASGAAGDYAVELFAGTGAMTAPLLKAGYAVDAYEVAAGAKASFEEVLEGLGDARWHRCDLLRDGVPRPRPRQRPDLVLLDPPRTGAAEIMPWVRASGAKALIYVSCDPATAFRDLAYLTKGAWEVLSVTGYDMFPHTGHQEVVAYAMPTDQTPPD
jgi:23S rRNA (uracil1939-C5)-methyltransferase